MKWQKLTYYLTFLLIPQNCLSDKTLSHELQDSHVGLSPAGTVKPVYNDRPRDPKFVAVVDRWSLFRGRFMPQRPKLWLHNGGFLLVTIWRWSLAQIWMYSQSSLLDPPVTMWPKNYLYTLRGEKLDIAKFDKFSDYLWQP